MVVVSGCVGDSSYLGGWMSGSEAHPTTDCARVLPNPSEVVRGMIDVGVLGFRWVFGSMSVVDGAPRTQSVRCFVAEVWGRLCCGKIPSRVGCFVVKFEKLVYK